MSNKHPDPGWESEKFRAQVTAREFQRRHSPNLVMFAMSEEFRFLLLYIVTYFRTRSRLLSDNRMNMEMFMLYADDPPTLHQRYKDWRVERDGALPPKKAELVRHYEKARLYLEGVEEIIIDSPLYILWAPKPKKKQLFRAPIIYQDVDLEEYIRDVDFYKDMKLSENLPEQIHDSSILADKLHFAGIVLGEEDVWGKFVDAFDSESFIEKKLLPDLVRLSKKPAMQPKVIWKDGKKFPMSWDD